MWPRILPFVVYMAFIGISQIVVGLSSDMERVTSWEIWGYPIKIVVVGGLLVWFWSGYKELRAPLCLSWQEGLQVVGVGLLVYVLWVRMDWPWAIQGELTGYNPFQEGANLGVLLAGIRLFGASVVVPVMEELFWRSFLIRWIVNPRFESVKFGTFTLGSFLVTVILFGLEHNLWLAGMMAGAAYNVLYYWTRRLWPCILAHALTNLVLGVHVLITQEWQWW